MPEPADQNPLAELEGFTMPTVDPLPPGEVRRRGDRIRRRNNALATVGGLAVVAAIVAPLAVVAGHDQGSRSVPPAGQPHYRQTVPAGFDITAVPQGSQVRFLARNDSVIDDFTVCGATAFSTAAATDAVGATAGEPGTDGGDGRTLAVYPDAQTADRALTDLQAQVRACPRDTGSVPYLWATVDAPTAGDDSAVISQQVRQSGYTGDLTLIEVVRVGNALFLGSTHTAAGGDQAIQGTLPALTALSQPVLDQMCAFSATGCTPGSPDASDAVEQPTGLSGTIPDDFPLEKGLPTGPGTMDGPGHEIDLAPYNLEHTLAACGTTPSGLPDPVDTFYAGYRTPAQGHLRTLMTFASDAEAQAYAEGVLVVFANCPRSDAGQGASKVYSIHPGGDLGDYAASAVMRVEVDGRPGTGYEVVQLVRVGPAVLQTLVVDDGDRLDAVGADQESTMLLENSQTVVDAMSM